MAMCLARSMFALVATVVAIVSLAGFAGCTDRADLSRRHGGERNPATTAATVTVATPHRSTPVPETTPAPAQAWNPHVEPLRLMLLLTDKGFYIRSRHGPECPEGVPEDARLCIRALDGNYTAARLKRLQHHLWYLFASKYKDLRHFAGPDDRRAILVVPEPAILYEDVVRVVDVIGEIPADATNVPLAHAIPAGGCTMKWDGDAWRFDAVGGVSTREAACMYDRVSLAMMSGH